jgi:hypothetical protein
MDRKEEGESFSADTCPGKEEMEEIDNMESLRPDFEAR